MSKQRSIEWFTLDDGDAMGPYPLTTNDNDDWLCPKCGKPCEYWEGQIDQDRMGNDIRGWAFHCYDCGIGSEATEGNWSGD